jgi:hypothetical protein
MGSGAPRASVGAAVRLPARPGVVAAVATGLATLAALGLLLGFLAPRWWRGDGGSYAPQRPIASARITPATSLFGQVLTARADVLVDPRAVDPATVDLDVDFRPYRIRSESRSIQRGVGRAQIVSFRYAIQCIARACVPRSESEERSRGAAAVLQPKAARLTAHTRDGREIAGLLQWPPVGVQSRLTRDQIALATPQAEQRLAPAAVSWRISPDVLGWLAVGAAAILVLGAGVLVALAVRGEARAPRLRVPAHMTPVARALALAEHAAAHGEVDESRKALEQLAEELRVSGAGGLAGDAERLAWSAHHPSTETVGALADTVRSNGVH